MRGIRAIESMVPLHTKLIECLASKVSTGAPISKKKKVAQAEAASVGWDVESRFMSALHANSSDSVCLSPDMVIPHWRERCRFPQHNPKVALRCKHGFSCARTHTHGSGGAMKRRSDNYSRCPRAQVFRRVFLLLGAPLLKVEHPVKALRQPLSR